MTGLGEGLIAALVILSGLFGLAGSVGLIKLKRPMQRLHAPTLAATVGVGAASAASMLYFALYDGLFTAQALLVPLFLLLTAPITAQVLARLHIGQSKPGDLPPDANATGWASQDPDA